MTLDRDLLIKLLNMTTSKHEGEVLSAIQKSNELLRRSKTSWSDLIKPEETPSVRPQPQPQPQSQPQSRASGQTQVPPERPREADFAAHRRHQHSGPGAGRANGYHSKYQARARSASLHSTIRSIPWLIRIPLFPLWLAAELYAGYAPAEQTRTRRGTAMVIIVILYVLCFGLSIAAINEAFGH